MQNNRPNCIRIGVYEIIDFNYFIPTIEQNIVNHLYDSGELETSNLSSVSNLMYYEIIQKFLELESEIPMFSKITHKVVLPFCTSGEFEKNFFQKIRRLSNLLSFKYIFNEYLTFDEFARLPIHNKVDKITAPTPKKSLKEFYKFLDINNMKNFKEKIQKTPTLKKKLLLNN